MGTEAKRQEQRGRTLHSAGWALGVGIALVEMQYGMDYVFTHVAGHMSTIVDWLPMLSTVAKQIWG
jgi:hypothetical protein